MLPPLFTETLRSLGNSWRENSLQIRHLKRSLISRSFIRFVTIQTIILTLKAQSLLTTGDSQLTSFEEAEAELRRNLYPFPQDWQYFSQIKEDWDRFRSLVASKNTILESHVPTLQEKLVEQLSAFSSKVQKLEVDWRTGRPLEGDIDYESALGALSLFNGRVQRLSEEWKKV